MRRAGSSGGDLDPLDAAIPDLQAAMADGRLRAVDLVGFHRARIDAYDTDGPELNALITINPRAGDQAAALDAERAASGPRGPLHGIPVVVKDNMGTADLPTTAGAAALAGFVPSSDAFQVRRLRDAGAVLLAKTNLFEFAYGWTTESSLGGVTRNPYDLSADPGGSSGGTAVAVTANLAVVGLGSDTCGSVRLPAARTNLYGLRPTEGLSSRAGVIPLSPTLDTVGPIARSVVDLAIVLEATVGVDPDDPTTVPVEAAYLGAVRRDGLAGRHIGVLGRSAGAEVDAVVAEALDEMAANGAEVVRTDGPDLSAERTVLRLIDEFPFALDDYLAAHPEAPVASVQDVLASGLPLDDGVRARLTVPTLDTPGYREALAQRRGFRDRIVAFMDDHRLDALAYPTTARHSSTAAMGGLPALAIPAGFTRDGMPVGLDLLGRPFDEPTLIAIAAGYEAHTEHRTLPPSTPPLGGGHPDAAASDRAGAQEPDGRSRSAFDDPR